MLSFISKSNFNICSVSLPNSKEKEWVLQLWYTWQMNQVSSLHQNIVKKTMEVYMIKKLTISFGTCAQFHCQIQNKKKEFCHYDIHEGWTERAHCTKMLLNKTVHVYMYKKTYHKLFYMCSVSLPNPKKKKKIVLSLRYTWGMTKWAHYSKILLKIKQCRCLCIKKTYHKLFNKCSVSLPNPKERKWVLSLW